MVAAWRVPSRPAATSQSLSDQFQRSTPPSEAEVEKESETQSEKQEIIMTGHTLKRLLAVFALLGTVTFVHAQNKPPTVTLTSNTTNEFVDAGTTNFLL